MIDGLRPLHVRPQAVVAIAVAIAVAALQAHAQTPAERAREARDLQARRQIESGVRGKLHANCDDSFTLRLNGRQIMGEGWPNTPPPKAVTLKPGDVLTVQAFNIGGVAGFSLIFVSNSRKVSFSSGAEKWFAYQPADPARWWDVGDFDRLAKAPATRATNQGFKGNIEIQTEALCKEAIWGDAADARVYLVKQITHEDLRD